MRNAAVARSEEVVPLVPRHRLHGLAFGALRSARRGSGSDIAGSRPYRPGDDVHQIDWAASARLSAARGSDEFVVRERFAEEGPRVTLVCDRRPTMGLYPSPWLDKRRALLNVADVLAEAALGARGLVGLLDLRGEEPSWHAPQAGRRGWAATAQTLEEDPFDGVAGAISLGFEHLEHVRASLPTGSFLFVCSDFLEPPPEHVWLTCLDRRWDVVPVVIQDATWERSFPAELGGLVVPVADPATGRVDLVRLSRRAARARRDGHEARLADLLAAFAAFGLDPVLIGDSSRESVLRSFLDWSELRQTPMVRTW